MVGSGWGSGISTWHLVSLLCVVNLHLQKRTTSGQQTQLEEFYLHRLCSEKKRFLLLRCKEQRTSLIQKRKTSTLRLKEKKEKSDVD